MQQIAAKRKSFKLAELLPCLSIISLIISGVTGSFLWIGGFDRLAASNNCWQGALSKGLRVDTGSQRVEPFQSSVSQYDGAIWARS